MANIGNLTLRVSSNITELQNGLRSAQASIAGFAKSATTAGALITTGLTLPLVMVGKKATEMAMEAIESENLFAVAMGGMADSTRAWSEQLQKDMGLNGYELRKNAALLNTMASAAGLAESASVDLAKKTTVLSHDMASFFNVAQGDALKDLQAIITGETEPMKKYGVLMGENAVKAFAYTNGIARQGEKLTDAQKIQARYGLVLKSTSKAQGDLARTLDSPTNKLRILKEQTNLAMIELGNALIPVLLNLMTVIQPLVSWFGSLTDAQMQMLAGTGLLLASLGPMITLFGMLSGVVAFLISPLGLVLTALSLLAVMFIGTEPIINTFKAVLKGLSGFMLNAFSGDMTKAVESIKTMLVSLFGVETTEKIMSGLTIAYEAFKTGIGWIQEHMGTFKTFLLNLWTTISTEVMSVINPMLTLIQEVWAKHGTKILEALKLWGTWIQTTFGTIFGILYNLVVSIWNNIKMFIDGALKVIMGFITLFAGILTGDWQAVWDGLVMIVDGALKMIIAFMNVLRDTAVAIVASVGTFLYNLIAGIMNTINKLIDNAINAGIGAINSLIDKFNSMSSLKLPDWAGGGSIGLPQLGKLSNVSSPVIPLAGQKSGSQAPIQNNVYLDGKKISDTVNRNLGAKVSMSMQ